jgi:hypothetical protein
VLGDELGRPPKGIVTPNSMEYKPGTNFGDTFGMVQDRFGVSWLVNVTQSPG